MTNKSAYARKNHPITKEIWLFRLRLLSFWSENNEAKIKIKNQNQNQNECENLKPIFDIVACDFEGSESIPVLCLNWFSVH